MIRVTVTGAFIDETREFKKSGRGIPTYLRRLKRLQLAHIEQAMAKELGPYPKTERERWSGKLTGRCRLARREWNERKSKINKTQPLKISIVHI